MRSFLPVLAWALGCGGGSGSPTHMTFNTFPQDQVYAAVDETGARYSVPIIAMDVSAVTYSSADPSIATVTQQGLLATVTGAQAGDTTINAMATGYVAVHIPTTIELIQTSDIAVGMQAFTTTYTCGRSMCHDSATHDVTPSGIGDDTDDNIVRAALSGMDPDGLVIQSHTFPLTTGEQKGIVAYLRSLPPDGPPKPMQP